MKLTHRIHVRFIIFLIHYFDIINLLKSDGTSKTPTRKIATWMISPGILPADKLPPKKIPTQDNSNPDKFHPG